LTEPMWQPPEALAAASNMAVFAGRAAAEWKVDLPDYAALHRWSVERREQFWSSVWDFCGVVGEKGGRVLAADGMPGARFFPDARLSFAENLLHRRGGEPAIIFRREDGLSYRFSRDETYDMASRVAAALGAHGIAEGDRVAGYLPNMPEAMCCMLGANAHAAVWSSCSPDFGVQGVIDRFGQIEPRVLFTVDGYVYAGKRIDIRPKVREIVERLPSLELVVVLPFLEAAPDLSGIRGAAAFADFLAPHPAGEIAFRRTAFDHPLCILFSSGTTGAPKCIVHSVGGSLLTNLKEHVLHVDEKPGDRVFYFTTLGWMMWNWLMGGLAAGSTLLLFDGSPFHPSWEVLWDYAAEEGTTVFGTSSKYIDSLRNAGAEPMRTHDLSKIKAILSTGSVLVPESFDYVYAHVKPDVWLASMSGGTDLYGCFVGGVPLLPVWRGEIQGPMLGMDVHVYDEDGRSVTGEKGELVCTRAFPSMPVRFWNDPEGEKYRAAYFSRFPGIWCHGDYAETTAHGGMVIYGRSDATLNPGGVRIGTAEIYRQVEQLDEVEEGIVIGQDWDNDTRVVLFVRLRAGATLDDALVQKIKRKIREGASPRHVPGVIAEVTDIPRTRSGKIVELAVRDVVHGRPVKNVEALDNPQALDQFRDRPELRA